jgi:CheY-like chemotaxis protein
LEVKANRASPFGEVFEGAANCNNVLSHKGSCTGPEATSFMQHSADQEIRSSRTILIVDDEWALAEVLSAILRDEGYRTLVAGNGREAETLLRSESVDLVVVDFMMPIMDAPELIAWMREQASLKSIPVIIMTSLPETSVRARADGFAAYLQKPFMIDDIAEAVSRHLPPQEPLLRS